MCDSTRVREIPMVVIFARQAFLVVGSLVSAERGRDRTRSHLLEARKTIVKNPALLAEVRAIKSVNRVVCVFSAASHASRAATIAPSELAD